MSEGVDETGRGESPDDGTAIVPGGGRPRGGDHAGDGSGAGSGGSDGPGDSSRRGVTPPTGARLDASRRWLGSEHRAR
jgi:hypothetical protein